MSNIYTESEDDGMGLGSHRLLAIGTLSDHFILQCMSSHLLNLFSHRFGRFLGPTVLVVESISRYVSSFFGISASGLKVLKGHLTMVYSKDAYYQLLKAFACASVLNLSYHRHL